MSRTTHLPRALAALVLGLAAAVGYAGGESAWKPFLPAEAQQELKARSIRTMEGIKGSAEQDKARKMVEYALVQGYQRAAAGGAELKLRSPQDLGEMMNLLRNKAKGGEGTAPELQYNAKLKKQDGIESLIGALSSKQPKADDVAKMGKELELLAYRVAVMGAITHDNPPGKDKLPEWRKLSLEMRDSAVALAEAAAKKSPADIQKASSRLENSCTQCHREFRK